MQVNKVNLEIIKIQLFRIYQTLPTPLYSNKKHLRLHIIVGNTHLVLFKLVENNPFKYK